MGQSAAPHDETVHLRTVIGPLPRALLEDRLSMIVHQANALEYAIKGAPIDTAPSEALIGLAMSLCDALGELLADVENKEGSE